MSIINVLHTSVLEGPSLKTSIVILTYNKLEYTRLCIDSIRQYTRSGTYEIIVVDNASTDGTVEWLKQQKDIRAVLNQENQGFPRGCNQGIEIAEGDSVLLLNNDTVVTANWLDNMHTALFSDESVGAVGSITNNCSYYQSIPVQYGSIEEMHAFAAINNQSDPSKWEQRIKLVGYSMLIKREVVERIGGLDERFTPGNYEDDDYSYRIREAGYKLLLCRDTFIHHFGSVSFREQPASYRELMNKNRKKFDEKWGFDPNYSSHVRHEVIGMINSPAHAELNVLEVGCACGGTLLEIKNQYPNANLYGIELNPHSAKMASLIADVRAENIEQEVLAYPQHHFDYIIFADVLEHLYDPWFVVRNMTKYLKHGGKLLISIPNVMHYSLLRDTINGNWTYTDAGLLDRTHVRFFTLNEVGRMMRQAGYKNLNVSSNTVLMSEEDKEFVNKLVSLSNGTSPDEFIAYQYLVRAESLSLDVAYNEAIQNSDNGESLKQLASFETEEVIAFIESSLTGKVEALNRLAILNFQYEQYEHVLPYLHKAVELEPEDRDSLFNLSYVLSVYGEPDLALQWLDRIAEPDSDVEQLKAEIGGGH